MKTLMAGQVLFWLLRAPDGHAKNFSIRILPRGRFQLTPLYDVMSVYPVLGDGPNQWSSHETKLAMALFGKNRHSEMHGIQRRHFNSTARRSAMLRRPSRPSMKSLPALLRPLPKFKPNCRRISRRMLPARYWAGLNKPQGHLAVWCRKQEKIRRSKPEPGALRCIVIEDDERPLIGCGIGPWDYSFETLRKTKECVLAVPTAELATKVVEIGNCSGAEIDKFTAFNLTPRPAKIVKAPLVAECLVNLECRLHDEIERYNLVILEVVHGWINPKHGEKRLIHHNGDGTFRVDGEMLDLRDKMVKWPSYVKR